MSTFATDSSMRCGSCLDILKRKGVAEGYYQGCFECENGVKIVGGKRVYTAPETTQKQSDSASQKKHGNDKEIV